MMTDCICGNQDGTNAECERCRLIARIKDLESFVLSVRDNYDCDEDGHKYDTGCRCCEADGLLGGRGFVAELCHVPYVSPEDKKLNEAMERGDYLRDRAKDEKQ